MTEEKHKNDGKTFTEQIEVTGNQLVDKVKELAAEGNVRRIILRAPDDKVMLEMTLTTAAVVGGPIALAAPWLAAIGAIAALVTKMRLEVVRDVSAGPEVITMEDEPQAERPSSTGKQKVRIEVED